MKKHLIPVLLALAPCYAFSANNMDLMKGEKQDPVQEFSRWQGVAKEYLAASRQNDLLNVVSLATVDSDGYPQQRHISISMINGKGFVFKTHRDSATVKQLEANKKASMLYLWPQGNKYIQIRVTGQVEEMPVVVTTGKADKGQQVVREYVLKPEFIQFDRGMKAKDTITTNSLKYKHEASGKWLVSRDSFQSPYVTFSSAKK
jgi:hypothetical protein